MDFGLNWQVINTEFEKRGVIIGDALELILAALQTGLGESRRLLMGRPVVN